MIDTNKLLGEIFKAGYTVKTGAKAIGMPITTFYKKMDRGVFNSDEIYEMIQIFDIKDVTEVFFVENRTKRKR